MNLFDLCQTISIDFFTMRYTILPFEENLFLSQKMIIFWLNAIIKLGTIYWPLYT